MSYVLTSEAITQDGADLAAAGNLSTVAGAEIGLTGALMTFDSAAVVPCVEFDGSIALSTGQGILDNNNLELLLFTVTATAVNYIDITNSATTNPPVISAAGSDTNIALDLETVGTGALRVGASNTGNAVPVQLFDGLGQFTGLVSSASLAGTAQGFTYTWPADIPTDGYVLSSTAAGVMSWEPDGGGAPAGGGTYTRILTGTSSTATANSTQAIISTSAGAYVLTLPATSTDGESIRVVDAGGVIGQGTTTQITVTPNALTPTQTIQGAATYVMNGRWESITLLADASGNSWSIV